MRACDAVWSEYQRLTSVGEGGSSWASRGPAAVDCGHASRLAGPLDHAAWSSAALQLARDYVRTWQTYARWEAHASNDGNLYDDDERATRATLVVTYETLRSSHRSCQAELLRVLRWLDLPSGALRGPHSGAGAARAAWEACADTSLDARSFRRSRNDSESVASGLSDPKLRGRVLGRIRHLVDKEAPELSNRSSLVARVLRARLNTKAPARRGGQSQSAASPHAAR
jgi:hypothetical protein